MRIWGGFLGDGCLTELVVCIVEGWIRQVFVGSKIF